MDRELFHCRRRSFLAAAALSLVALFWANPSCSADDGGGPLEKLGWTTKECMLCQTKRTDAERKKYSDSRGFGFCAKCGKKADAFATVYSNSKDGIETDLATFLEGKAYMQDVQKLLPDGWMNTDAGKAKGLLLMTAFGNWRTRRWEEGWNDAITIGLRKSDIDR